MGVKRKIGKTEKKKAGEVAADGDGEDCNGHGSEVTVSTFDYSVENYFRAMHMIAKLCGEEEADDITESSEIAGLSSSITFLREWRQFNYPPRIIKFALESPQGKYVVNTINLPQFSSATVPKEGPSEADSFIESSKDFVLNAGGHIWALDWCPRASERSNNHIKCEFIAVAAHPPDSAYHKIGSAHTGRGVVQIWCLLNFSVNEDEVLPPFTEPIRRRGRPRKNPIDESSNVSVNENKSTKPKKARGRPRKKPVNESSSDLDCSNQSVQALVVHVSESSSELHARGVSVRTNEYDPENKQEASIDISEHIVPENHHERQNGCTQAGKSENEASAVSYNDDTSLPLLTPHEGKESTTLGAGVVSNGIPSNDLLGISLARNLITKDVALPKVVLCLAHNGKVAWDVKWQPSYVNSSECKHRLGYLAVLLGNGSLEVWEVPRPHAIEVIYSSSHGVGTDPRFLKLEPVFRCSKLKCGNIQSIPLTVEWSAMPPHDLLLAGCHDGMVALWKFSANGVSRDTRPLLCFSADTAPIRALAWAPDISDRESANVIVTAGHGGLKFWDIRDPYHPLCSDIIPAPRIIYSLDWFPDPRCVLLSLDDGTIRMLSLVNVAYDVPVTGKLSIGSKPYGMNIFTCSSFAVWSVQVSRITGMIAYCTADGNVLRFQLSTQAKRYPAPHFMCGSLTEEESILTVNTQIFMQGLLSLSYQAKAANEKKAKNKTSADPVLAICDRDDSCTGVGAERTVTASKNKQKPTIRNCSNKRLEDEMVCTNKDDTEIAQAKDNKKKETETEVEVLPPKIVAMHRVRWNNNKGSEKWLCYGGAAGILRCQKIINSGFPSTVKRLKG